MGIWPATIMVMLLHGNCYCMTHFLQLVSMGRKHWPGLQAGSLIDKAIVYRIHRLVAKVLAAIDAYLTMHEENLLQAVTLCPCVSWLSEQQQLFAAALIGNLPAAPVPLHVCPCMFSPLLIKLSSLLCTTVS